MTQSNEDVAARKRPRAITRREFGRRVGILIAGCGVLSAAQKVGIAAASPASHTLSRPLDLLATLDRSAFSALAGQSFLVRSGAPVPVQMQLVEVAEVRQPTASAGQPGGAVPSTECFSLRFRGPSANPLSQNSYLFEHKVGSFQLFIVPSAPSADEQQYVAIVNRLIS
ncbi:MAG TPA: hypothetical protein VHS06_05520 [Chloroflexota bacterium]|nr:hypothetical protein [Chloroflexota bacterium]